MNFDNKKYLILIIFILIIVLSSIGIFFNSFGLFIDNNTATTNPFYLEQLDSNDERIANHSYINMTESELSECSALFSGVNTLLKNQIKTIEIELDRDQYICIMNFFIKRSPSGPPINIFYVKGTFFIYSMPVA